MPINPIVLQRRHAELGRIRLGNQVATQSGNTRPNKLDKFRFTSASEQFIRDLAALYGGEARQWDNNGKPEWEVYSTTQSLQVIVVKGGLSQWMEFWSGGGCIHRCDGVTNQLTDEPCDVNEKVQVGRKMVNPHTEAKPTTRLSVMLPELEAIGVWRMESHGWNAAAEIPAIAELAQYVGDLVPARLHLMERRTVKDGQTSRFVVPVLDLQIGSARLKEIVAEKSGVRELSGGSAPALEANGGGVAAIEAARPDYLAQAQDASTLETVQAIWRKARDAGHMTDELNAQLQIIGNRFVAPAPGPDVDGAYDAVVVDEGAAAAADMAWQRVLMVAGRAGLTRDETDGEYAQFSGGELPASASAEQLDAFCEYLAAGHDVQVSA